MKNNWLLIGLLLLVPFFGTSQPVEKPCFSVRGGFYEDVISLEIHSFYQQHHIRFTTNGNRPTAQSRLYTEPLLLDGGLYSTSDIHTIQVSPDDLVYVPDSVQHCIVIRAAVFDENDSCVSEVVTNSYFIRSLGCDTHGLPVVSICADSLDLFDYHHGIFVPGVHFNPSNPYWTGNYYQSGKAWERPMNIEFYELDNCGINQQAGLRTHGGNGRRFPQKCLKCYAREEYGQKRFKHQFFNTIPHNSFKHLVLKPFEASWNDTGVNDYLSNLYASQLNVESLASRPVLLYLNGEYWGVYFIHERPDERYLEDHFDVDIEQVNIMAGWNSIVDCGTSYYFDSLYHWVETADLADEHNFNYFKSRIDLNSFIDYQILELFLENTDWPANNMRCWQLGNGPWRWIFYDGDACLRWMTFNAFENSISEADSVWPSNAQSTLFFRKLLNNTEFCRLFYLRFQELLNTCFSYAVTGQWFEEIQQILAPEIPFQVGRFGIPQDVDTWNDFMGRTQWFMMKRCEYVVPVLERFLHLSVRDDFQSFVKVYPNPFSSHLTLDMDSDVERTLPLVIHDVLGRQVYSQTISLQAGSNALSLELSLSPGVYFMKIGDGVVKIVRQ